MDDCFQDCHEAGNGGGMTLGRLRCHKALWPKIGCFFLIKSLPGYCKLLIGFQSWKRWILIFFFLPDYLLLLWWYRILDVSTTPFLLTSQWNSSCFCFSIPEWKNYTYICRHQIFDKIQPHGVTVTLGKDYAWQQNGLIGLRSRLRGTSVDTACLLN